jgi:two-component system invasion response regulator UvrY
MDIANISEGSVSATSEVSTLKVMIVDDQPPFRSVARTLVSLLGGWQLVGEVGSGEDAVQAASALAPDVILMDINMPGMSGVEATREILAQRPSTRVLLLSTYAAEDLPADAMSCGAIGYLRKEELTPRLLREICE